MILTAISVSPFISLCCAMRQISLIQLSLPFSGGNDHATRFWCRNRPGDLTRDKYNSGQMQGSFSFCWASFLVYSTSCSIHITKYHESPHAFDGWLVRQFDGHHLFTYCTCLGVFFLFGTRQEMFDTYNKLLLCFRLRWPTSCFCWPCYGWIPDAWTFNNTWTI